MTTITRVNYHGWPDSYLINNGKVEAVVVPAISREMQFRLVDDPAGVFWENRLLDGKQTDPESSEWANFGGDKSWPAPQSDWEKVTERAWPPPAAFDSLPSEAVIQGDELILTSKVDEHYGIQTVRRIQMAPALPVMSITTEYRKIAGSAVQVSVWVITQMRSPERMYAHLPEQRSRPEFLQLMGPVPQDLRIEGRLLSLSRDPKEPVKIGSAASSMVWMDRNFAVRIDSNASQKEGEFPDGDSRSEIYTNPDPQPYVELETLGPLTEVNPGDRIALTNIYTLARRFEENAKLEAEKMFGLRDDPN